MTPLLIIFILAALALPHANAQCNAIIDSYGPTAQSTMANSDYEVQVSKGLLTGQSIVRIVGIQDDQSAALVRNLIQGQIGVTNFVTPTAAGAITIASSSALDTLAGTGCQVVSVEGLDASGNAATASINMLGTTAVAVAGTWSYINRLTCTQAGTLIKNAGYITITGATFPATSTPQIGLNGVGLTSVAGNAVAPFGVSYSTSALYKVATGKSLLLRAVEISATRVGVGVTTSTTFYIFYRTTATGPNLLYDLIALENDGTSSYRREYSFASPLPAGTFVWAEVAAGTDPTTVTIIISGVLY